MSMGEPHVISSQAGLASFIGIGVATAMRNEARPTITIRTESGVVFELVQHENHEGWTVIGSIGRQSTTAEAIVGMKFYAGGNPNWWAKGYAMRVQSELNKQMADIITEVPL